MIMSKKIFFIAIIFFVIISQVHSEIDKRAVANANQCIKLGGTCKSQSSCNGIIKSNLCPGSNKCCIPKKTAAKKQVTTKKQVTVKKQRATKQQALKQQQTAKQQVLKKQQAAKQKNTKKLATNKKTVATKIKTNNKKTANNTQCAKKGGKCLIYLTNKNKCNGTFIGYSYCGTKSHNCCIPKKVNNQKTPVTKKPVTKKPASNVINNKNQCTSKGGKCLMVTNKNKCTGTLNGMCSKSQYCCIPKKIKNQKTPVTKKIVTKKTVTKKPASSVINNKNQCTSRGGKCLMFANKNKCTGTLNGMCSKSQYCCMPKKIKNQKTPVTKKSVTTKTVKKNTSLINTVKKLNKITNKNQCTNKGGHCINFLNKNSCNGTINGICNKSQSCCIPKKKTTNKTSVNKVNTNKANTNKATKNKVTKNKATLVNDTLCINEGGQCMNPNNCSGAVKKGLCPGGADNRCCIMNVTPVGGGNTVNNVPPVVNINTTNNVPPVVDNNTANNITPVNPVGGGNTDLGNSIVDFAKNFVGNPYLWGGNSLTNGIDCSGFAQQVFANFGIPLERTSKAQSQKGTLIDSINNAKAADLFFYCNNNADLSTVHHVAIYEGPNTGYIVHAKGKKYGIVYEPESNRSSRPCVIRRYF